MMKKSQALRVLIVENLLWCCLENCVGCVNLLRHTTQQLMHRDTYLCGMLNASSHAPIVQRNCP
jgi:hypothetical protein